MAVVMVEVLGLILAFIGWCLESSSANSAVWRISANAESRSSSQYEGLWKSCSSGSLGVQCVVHRTSRGLPGYIQACRALMIIALLLGLVSIILSFLGLKCIKLCGTSETCKGKLTLTAGVISILSGLCVLSAVSWYADRVIKEFNDPLYFGTRSEWGSGLYLGWAAAVCVILGGGMLCGSCKRASAPKRPSDFLYEAAS